MSPQDPDPSEYDVAQICLNGHFINDRTQELPRYNAAFCPDCGAKTITSCQHCNVPIRGRLFDSQVISFGQDPAPNYCLYCGKPFPWTATAIDAARQLTAESDGLSAEEKSALTNTFSALTSDTPATPLAASRFRRLVAKMGNEFGPPLKQIMISVATEAAKKGMGM